MITTQIHADIEDILAVHRAAFGQPDEAHLVAQLIAVTDFNAALSMVARIDNVIVGHVLFTPLQTDNMPTVLIAALAPMAVLPDFQGKGVGGALIDKGVTALAQLSFAGIVVLGETLYYSRFGFSHRLVAHIDCVYQSEHYMGYEIVENTFNHIRTLHYPATFSALKNAE